MSSLYSFYKNTPGLQLKRDMDFSNVTIQCDPRLVVPDNATTQTAGIFKKDTAGKIAVEHEICDLDVRNLTVNGKLTATLAPDGISEICDIVCPEDFNVTAGVDVNLTADVDVNLTATTGEVKLTATGGPVSLEAPSGIAGVNSTVTVIGHLNAKDTQNPSKYKPLINAQSSTWSGLVTLVGGSTDTAGKITLDNSGAVGQTISILFGTAFQNAPVVQITFDKNGTGVQGDIVVQTVSNTIIILRLENAVNQPNSTIHYTVIGLD